MRRNIDKKVLKDYLKINLSTDKPNTKFSQAIILLVLLNCTWACKTVHAIADSPSEDTVFYRLKPTLTNIDQYLWNSSLDILRKNKSKWNRKRVFLCIDETHESYYGKFRKAIEWIFGYKHKQGETGNFRFLTFALTNTNQRLVVRTIPVKVGQDTNPIILETILKLMPHVRIYAVLFDRGFYKSELVKMLQDEKIHFIIRAKIPKKISKCFDFKKKAEGELYDFQGISVYLIRVRDSKSRKYGFLTNLPQIEWQNLLSWYKLRWNIENIFLACDGIHLRTNSTKVELRYFCVVFSFLLYNLRSNKKEVKPLLDFLIQMISIVFDSIKQCVSECANILNLKLPLFNI